MTSILEQNGSKLHVVPGAEAGRESKRRVSQNLSRSVAKTKFING